MSVRSAKLDELARKLARLTGEDVETAHEKAIEERLSRVAITAPADKKMLWIHFSSRYPVCPFSIPVQWTLS
jgi:hypothetical protein